MKTSPAQTSLPRHQSRHTRRLVLGYGTLVVLLVLAMGVSLLLGVGIQPIESWHTLWHSTSDTASAILLQLRLPRVILAVLVGAALSVSGVLMQGMFLNPLADPHILGVSSGAGLGAAAAITLGLGTGFLGLAPVTILAFAGGLASVIAVYFISRQYGKVQTVSLLLAGVAMGSFLSAGTTMLMRLNREKLEAVYLWTMGSLASAGWKQVLWCLPFAAAGTTGAMFFARDLNILSQGEENAALLGVQVHQVQLWLMVIAALTTSSAVAVSGVIGFVGLMVPHLLRSFFGPDHRHLIPLSALGGGLFLLVMDTLSRTLAAPAELPVGVLTALCGGPFFVYILRKKRYGGS